MANLFAAGRFVVAFVLVGTSASAFADDAKHTLRYRFTAGESVYFTAHNETSRRLLQAQNEIQTKDSVDALKHYRVLSVTPDGGAVLELMIDRTRMQVEQGSTLFVYDSTKDKDPPAAFLIVHASVGRPWLHVTVNAVGETTNYKTPTGMKVPESPDFVSRVLPLLPEQAVAVGDSWKEQFSVDVPVADIEVEEGKPLTRPVSMQRVYKLKSVENNVATLEFKTEVLTGKRTPKEDVALIQRKFAGTITIDVANGRLLGRDMSIDGNVVGYDGPNSAMYVKMTQRDVYAPAGVATAEPAAVAK